MAVEHAIVPLMGLSPPLFLCVYFSHRIEEEAYFINL